MRLWKNVGVLFGQMTLSAARNGAAPNHAHLHAIKDRKRGHMENIGQSIDSGQVKSRDQNLPTTKRDYLKGISVRNPNMKEPKAHGSLSWRKRKDLDKSESEAELISSAAHGLNKFATDGSFLQSFSQQKQKDVEDIAISLRANSVESGCCGSEFLSANSDENEVSTTNKAMSANYLAFKVLQLRKKGKHEDAEKLLKESEGLGHMEKRDRNTYSMSTPSRSGLTGIAVQKQKSEEDADMHLAMKIMRNRQYKASEQADNEYDYDDVSAIKSKKKQKAMRDHVSVHQNVRKQILTQQERCQFCFENPNRPKHLDGHCCILPMRHESSTRNLDDIWDELCNFIKCLLRMFAEQEKDVIFLETAIALSQPG